jgi:hypothetical protein
MHEDLRKFIDHWNSEKHNLDDLIIGKSPGEDNSIHKGMYLFFRKYGFIDGYFLRYDIRPEVKKGFILTKLRGSNWGDSLWWNRELGDFEENNLYISEMIDIVERHFGRPIMDILYE